VSLQQLKDDARYTYADYCKWDDHFRCELIRGVIYVDGQPFDGQPPIAAMMAPAPLWGHQKISGELYRQLANFLKGKPCKIFHPPFDVRLNVDSEDDTTVQPDLVVICDQSKLSGTGCKGVPDMVIEVLSPSTARQDRVVKFNLYGQAGVREYWIVDPDSKTVQICILEDGRYFATAFSDTGTAPVRVLPGCEIDLHEVFAE